MAIANTNTGNSGAHNGAVYQVMRGQRRFLKLLGAPYRHDNVEFAISTSYESPSDVMEKFTETTENGKTKATHTDYTSMKNTFSFLKGRVEVSQTRLNAAKFLDASDENLKEAGASYYLTDAWQAQWRPFLQGVVRKINSELINSTYTAFTQTDNTTRGLLEAAEEYAKTNVDIDISTGDAAAAEAFVEGVEDLFVAMRNEGVTTSATEVFYPAQISGTEADTPIAATLKVLGNTSDRLAIERVLRKGGNGTFQMERNSTDAGVAINRLITSFGILEFVEDDDVPAGKMVVAKFEEMRPVYQGHNSLGHEGKNGAISPEDAMLHMWEDTAMKQGLGVEVFTRVGLDHGATNRIGLINLTTEPAGPAPAKSAAPKKDKEESKTK